MAEFWFGKKRIRIKTRQVSRPVPTAVGISLVALSVFIYFSFGTLHFTYLFFIWSRVAILVLFSIGNGLVLYAYLGGSPRIYRGEVGDTESPSYSGESSLATQTGTELDDLAAQKTPPSVPSAEAPWTASDPRESRIAEIFFRTQLRLEREIEALGRRSNTNLVAGVMITGIATATLIYLVTRPHADFANLAGVLGYYIPRVTTIALIEIFAYFFLGLYKANLEEIKYYQNERTTLAAIEIAWRASLWPEIGTPTADVIGQIVRVNRNPIVSGLASSETSLKAADVVELLKALSKFAPAPAGPK